MARRDCVRCVADTHEDAKGHTWCGRKIEPLEWTFTGADHAAMNGRNGDRLVACPQCVKAIEAGLRNGHEEK